LAGIRGKLVHWPRTSFTGNASQSNESVTCACIVGTGEPKKIDFYRRGKWIFTTLEIDFYHCGKLIFTTLEIDLHHRGF